jgi:hypothetical protein
MKSRVVVLGLGVSLLLSVAAARPARANADAVQIQRAVVLTTLRACAIQMAVTHIVNNQTNGSEALLLNGVKIAGIARIAALGLALQGKSFLVASPAFEAETGETADETISDDDCEKLTPGAKLEFRGSFGNMAGSATLPNEWAVQKAIIWTSGGLLVDLLINSIQLVRFAAALILVGNGPLLAAIAASSGGGGGCSVAAVSTLGWAAILALTFAFVLAARRRHAEAGQKTPRRQGRGAGRAGMAETN